MDSTPANIDFRPVKQEVRRRFSPGHPLREIVLQQPDISPRHEGLVRVEMLVWLTCATAGDPNMRVAQSWWGKHHTSGST